MLKKLLFSICFLINGAQTFAQTDYNIDTLLSNIKKQYPVNPLEKVYLSLDRKSYLAGDTIWMSGFLSGAQNNLTGPVARILDIELINPAGTLVFKQRLLIKDGIGSGQLPLRQGLIDGHYRLSTFIALIGNSRNKPVFSTNIFIGTRKSLPHHDDVKHILEKLPKETNVGYSVDIEQNINDSVRVILQAGKNVSNKEKIFLVPIAEQKPLFVFPAWFSDGKITLDIPGAKLPDGLVWFCLFRADGMLLARRTIFCSASLHHKVNILGLQKSNPTNHQVKLPFEVIGKEGRPIEGTFAISVSKVDSVRLNTKVPEIEKSLFITPYLSTGFVDTLDNDYNASELELISEQQINTAFFARQPDLKEYLPETGIPIRGMIKKKGKGLAAAKVSLIIGNLTNGMFADAVSDMEGRFSFSVPDSLVFTPMRLQLAGDKEAREIVLDSVSTALAGHLIISQSLNVNQFSQPAATLVQKSALAPGQEGIKLNTVTIKGQKEAYKSTNLNGSGNADVIIGAEVLDEMIDLSTLDVLLPGTQMIGGGKALRLRSGVGAHSPNVLILINGTDGGDLNTISPRDIARIEFMKSPAYAGIYGIRGSGGVLLITTKNGSERKTETNNNGTLELEFPAEYARIFKYNPKQTGSTVFWTPHVKTDWAGRGEIQFNSGLLPGDYMISIEGIGIRGEICSQKFTYKVE